MMMMMMMVVVVVVVVMIPTNFHIVGSAETNRVGFIQRLRSPLTGANRGGYGPCLLERCL